MSRERSRLVQGFFPSQPRVCAAIAKLVQPGDGNVTVLDAGCGTGAAIAALKEAWGKPSNVRLYGIESDKDRAASAEKVLDECLCGCIEDCRPSAGVSCVWLNAPYDTIRGEGRLELEIFNAVKDWPMRKTGVLVLIVPKAILTVEYSDLARAVEASYEVQAFDYPEPERDEFGQCVVIGTRRAKDISVWDTPAWAEMQWPTLPLDAPRARWTLKPSAAVNLRRIEVSDEVIGEVLATSPLRHALLQEALQPEPAQARPCLPLRAGHVALLLAGGLEQEVNDPEHGRFLVKGSLQSESRKIRADDKVDSDGTLIAHVDVYRTKYILNVAALRETGDVERFSSEPEQEPVEVADE